MTTHVSRTSVEVQLPSRTRALRYVVPVGRALFAAIFVISALGHFSQESVGYAASQGVPFASVLVPLSGLMAIAGGLSVLLGYRTRWGAALLIGFLVPVTLMMHRFWSIPDPQMAMMQQAMFLKNVSMLGGALLLLYLGSGPFGFDSRRRPR
jgi:putative oxidoreductase